MAKEKLWVEVDGFKFEFSKNEPENIRYIKTKERTDLAYFGHEKFQGKVKTTGMRTFETEVKGRTFRVQVKNSIDQVVESLGLNQAKSNKLSHIKAPMPGLVIQIDLKEGQKLEENEKVLILEAMKMENVIRIPHEAIVKKVLVKEGQAVDKGQVLVELE